MNETELSQTIDQRIRARFHAVQVRGGGAVQVGGADGHFSVAMPQPPQVSAPMEVQDPPYPRNDWEVFKAETTGGMPCLFIRYAMALNDVYYEVAGVKPFLSPHVTIPLEDGKKIYVMVNLTTTAAGFHGRFSPGSPPSRRFTGVTINSAEIRAVDYDVVPAAAGYEVIDPDHPGTYDIRCLLARYNAAGEEDPPDPTDYHDNEYAGNPFQSSVYGKIDQRFQTSILQKFNLFSLV